MARESKSKMRILATITSWGTANDRYLSRIVTEYSRMPFDVDIVVTSNIAKNLGANVEVIRGVPGNDPWSLGFAHKSIFAERAARYDLFIYSEDDVLITERNIRAFLRMTETLPKNEIAGFLRTETDSAGKLYFSDVQYHYHWDAATVRQTVGHTFAFFTNEHAACYALTHEQLVCAIDSGKFLVKPHQGKYPLPETAATDPYTQCGFKKMVCVSDLDDFLIPHLPNKYAGKGPLPAEEFYRQLAALTTFGNNGRPKTTLFPVETNLYHEHFSKSYYEPCQNLMIELVPVGAQNLLSIGCGWGSTEHRLMERGIRVKALPIDSVIAATAEARGVEIVYGDLKTARKKLAGDRFDCLLISNVLHLVRDPIEFLTPFIELLNPEGCVVASVPNLSWIRIRSRKARFPGHHAVPSGYDVSGMHSTNGAVLRGWFRQAGLTPTKTTYEPNEKYNWIDGLSFGLTKHLFGSRAIVVGVRTAPSDMASCPEMRNRAD